MINVQKASRLCVNTRFTPGAPVQAQEAADGYGLCRCFCQEPDQGCAKEDAPSPGEQESKLQCQKFQWLQCLIWASVLTSLQLFWINNSIN